MLNTTQKPNSSAATYPGPGSSEQPAPEGIPGSELDGFEGRQKPSHELPNMKGIPRQVLELPI